MFTLRKYTFQVFVDSSVRLVAMSSVFVFQLIRKSVIRHETFMKMNARESGIARIWSKIRIKLRNQKCEKSLINEDYIFVANVNLR